MTFLRTRASWAAQRRCAREISSSSKDYLPSTIASFCRFINCASTLILLTKVCFERRLKRDVEQRGRTEGLVRLQYETTVRPSSLAFVRPSAKNADLRIDGALKPLDWKVEQVMDGAASERAPAKRELASIGRFLLGKTGILFIPPSEGACTPKWYSYFDKFRSMLGSSDGVDSFTKDLPQTNL